MRNITYDVSELYTFLDQMTDVSCLVFHEPISAYVPRNKDWVKRQVFAHLKGQAHMHMCM